MHMGCIGFSTAQFMQFHRTDEIDSKREEPHGSQERITYFCQGVAQMRATDTGKNSLASGFLAEIETMHEPWTISAATLLNSHRRNVIESR